MVVLLWQELNSKLLPSSKASGQQPDSACPSNQRRTVLCSVPKLSGQLDQHAVALALRPLACLAQASGLQMARAPFSGACETVWGDLAGTLLCRSLVGLLACRLPSNSVPACLQRWGCENGAAAWDLSGSEPALPALLLSSHSAPVRLLSAQAGVLSAFVQSAVNLRSGKQSLTC